MRASAAILIATFVLALAATHTAQALTPYTVEIPPGLIEPDIPLDRPLTVEEVTLGRKLFFDQRLSASGTTSCATCHDECHAFADSRKVSVLDNGKPAARNSPSLLNAGFLTTTMWDGRFRTLEQQALGPFQVDGDMGNDVGDAIARIAEDAEYKRLFASAFGTRVTVLGMTRAIASFERSLVTGGSRFDRYLFMNERNALSEQERVGLQLFLVQGDCVVCHDIFHPSINPLGGRLALLSDLRFHNLGVGYTRGRMSDTGRFYWSRDAEDWGAFRTPSLRNVALTAPYMHDGSLATLEDVVDFYDRGGEDNPNRSPTLRRLVLRPDQKRALVAFLKTLTDPKWQARADECAAARKR